MSLRFVERGEELNKIAYPLAMEAVLGVLAKGEALSEEAAHAWIVTTLGEMDPSKEILTRTMNFVQRVVSGPRPIAGGENPLI